MPRANKSATSKSGAGVGGPPASKLADVILPMQDPYMSQIINGTKNYEFRKYCLKPGV